jgi:Fe-S oxidoreductase
MTQDKLREAQLLFYPIGNETIDKWLEEANKKIKRAFEEGRKEALQDEIEYIIWLLEHKGKGYTTAFYENNLEERLNKLRCKLLLLPEEKKE